MFAADRDIERVSCERLRILHVIQNLNYGGMERLMADLVRRVDRDRFESHVLVLQYLGRFAEEMRGVATLHQAPAQPRYSMLWPAALANHIRRIRPDVVHTHSGVWYKASLAARIAGVPRIIHTEHGRHTPDPWQARLVDGLASRRTSITVAVSETVATQLDQRVVRGRCPIGVVLNGVDTELHLPLPDTGRIRRELGLNPRVPVIGSIGRLENIKGYDYMVEAFRLLASSWRGAPPPVLVVAGDGSERTRLQEAARAAGLAQRIFLLGWRDDVHDLHSAFSLFTMSSHSEGTSVSLLEAMSAALCPIVTDVGGNSAVLGDDLRHRLVPAADPHALAAAWETALADSGARDADGTRARSRVQTAYGLGQMVAAYEDLYAGAGPANP